jgi:hypothetical protein
MIDQKTRRDPRAERLRTALRENLKRRKAQAKAKSGGQSVAQRDRRQDAAVADSDGSPNSAGFAPDKPKS